MDQTARIGLPLIAPEQALKHVTHNQGLVALDALVQLAVKDRDLTAPPGSPAEGDAYIVGASATGAWAGEDDHIAAWQNGGWAFYVPNEGWIAWVEDEDALVGWDGGAWVIAGGGANPTPLVGVNATADSTNRLSVRSNAVLFDAIDAAESGDGDCRIKVNKETAGDTASHLFQTGFSGRAEMGLAGDDDFHFKVSPDGSAWYEAMVVDKDSGAVSFPNGPLREVLTADRTYYVRSDGDDGNDGLTNGAGGAFATLQAARDAILALDLNGHTVTIKIGNTATLTVGLEWTVPPLGGNVILEGDVSTPSNTIISTTGANAVAVRCAMSLAVQSVELRTTTSGNCLFAEGAGARIEVGAGVRFGVCAGYHCRAISNGYVKNDTNDYTISGGASQHYAAALGGVIELQGSTVTLTGTPAFSNAFALATVGAVVSVYSMTFSGSATGKRYDATMNGAIQTYGGGANFFPGNSAGSTGTGGQYA